MAEQNGVCALCFSPNSRSSSARLCIDHDHANNMVRGLLCAKCNTALERFDSDPEWPIRALEYLSRYENEHARTIAEQPRQAL
jgi:hypothetical protein